MDVRKPEMDEDLITQRQLFLSDLLLSRDLCNKYKQLKTSEERFKFVLDIIIENSTRLFDSEYKHKISEKSTKLREMGNMFFKGGEYHVALQGYTESIMYAEDSSEELAFAYSNRSAALFELNKYADCIDDIDKVLDMKHPDKLKPKLYKRKGLCLNRLGRPGADSLFKSALIWLDKMKLSQNEMDKAKNELQQLISAPSTAVQPAVKATQHPVPEILTPNPEIPSASDAVALKYSKELGRHLVATRKIKPGELLVLEKPYCLKLLPKYDTTYCEYCLQVSWALIPCKYCVYAGFCSDACRDKAWDEYHEIECPVVGILRSFGANDALWVAMRMTIMATRNGTELNALKQELVDIERNTDPRTKGFSNDGKLHSDQYRSVCSLPSNVDTCNAMLLLYGGLWAALTICALAKESKLFGKKLTLDDTLAKNQDVIFVGALMLKHVHICWIKTHCYGASYRSNAYEHGQALMALRGLINHSCDPNTIKQWYANGMALYAAYPIEEGEQILDNNGLRYLTMTKSQRQEYFKLRDSKCECIACTENWPLLSRIPSYKKQPLTRQNKNKLNKVLSTFANKFNGFMKKGASENGSNMMEELIKLIDELFKVVNRPCSELAMAVVMLSDLYASNDAVFDYVPLKSPAIEMQCSVFYHYLLDTLSKI